MREVTGRGVREGRSCGGTVYREGKWCDSDSSGGYHENRVVERERLPTPLLEAVSRYCAVSVLSIIGKRRKKDPACLPACLPASPTLHHPLALTMEHPASVSCKHSCRAALPSPHHLSVFNIGRLKSPVEASRVRMTMVDALAPSCPSPSPSSPPPDPSCLFFIAAVKQARLNI